MIGVIIGLVLMLFVCGISYQFGKLAGMGLVQRTYQDIIESYKSTIETYKKIVVDQRSTISFWKGTIDAIASQQPVLPDGKGRKH